jgi:hypothetical protein
MTVNALHVTGPSIDIVVASAALTSLGRGCRATASDASDDGSLSEAAAPSIISAGAEVYPMRFPRFVLLVLGFF